MYCKNCGEKLVDDSNFCEKCGAPIEKDKSLVANNIDNKEETKVKVSFLDEAVADLAPDDSDDLMPKKRTAFVVGVVFAITFLALLVFLYFNLVTPDEKKKGKDIDYQEIINEYAKSIEEVTGKYLLEHELINDFSEIEDMVKYNKHKVICDNVFINIDGTVYLSKCSVDGKDVDAIYGKKKNILTKEESEVCYTNYNEDSDELEFYLDGEIVSVYECKSSDCDLYEVNEFKYNSCLDQIAVIKDGDILYLYSYRSGQDIVEPFSLLVPVKKDNKTIGFIVKSDETSKYGYVDTRGTIKLNLKYDDLGLISDNLLYERGINLSEDKIIAKKDDLYGVISLSTGNNIVPFKYERIYLGANDHYIYKENKLYYLMDKSGNKLLENGYDMIFAFDKLLIVCIDNKLKFIDYEGNSIIDSELDIYIDYKDEPVSGVFGYNAYLKGDKVIIDINKSTNEGYETITYEYSVKNKKLEKQA